MCAYVCVYIYVEKVSNIKIGSKYQNVKFYHAEYEKC